MAYLEQGAIIRIHKLSSSSVNVPNGTSVAADLSLLNYTHNTINQQEKDRLVFGQMESQHAGGSYGGFFSHSVETSESTTTTWTLPDNMRAAFERALASDTGIYAQEMSCALVGENDYSRKIKILALSSSYAQDNIITKTTVTEIL